MAASPVSVKTKQSEYGEGLYVFPVKKTYLVFYELNENGITVARVLHGKRDIPSVFEEAFDKQTDRK